MVKRHIYCRIGLSDILPNGVTTIAVPVEAHRPKHGMESAMARVRSLKGDTCGDKPLTETL